MIKISLILGPNLNLIGSREPEFYGRDSFDEINRKIKVRAQELDLEVRILQSNHEGELVDAIQDARTWADAIVINPVIRSHGMFSENGHAEVWLSYDSTRAIVRLTGNTSFGRLRLELKSIEYTGANH